jgi:hypothetical protein
LKFKISVVSCRILLSFLAYSFLTLSCSFICPLYLSIKGDLSSISYVFLQCRQWNKWGD